MNKLTKILLSATAIVVLSVAALFGGCTINVGNDGKDGKDGADMDWEAIYRRLNEELVANGEEELTFGEFVKGYLGVRDETSSQAAINHSLLSSVSVFTTFDYRTSMQSGFFGSTQTVEYSSVYCGSGVIVEMDKAKGNATVITNCHVVYDGAATSAFSEDVRLYLYGQDTVDVNFTVSGQYIGYTGTGDVIDMEITGDEDYRIDAQIIGASLTYDIAVLKIENSEVLKNSAATVATFTDDADYAKAGSSCYAVGNPGGYSTSLTYGKVSVDSEIIQLDIDEDGTETDYRVLRTDTAINGGNSGGGLYNEYGDLIGIVNAKMVEEGTDNMGYALPATTVKRVYQSLVYNADELNRTSGFGILHAKLGITVNLETGSDANAVKYEHVKVAEVSSGSLWRNILSAGDTIVRIEVGTASSSLENLSETEQSGFTARDGADVTRKFMLDDVLLGVRQGETVKLTISRGNKTYYAYVTYSATSDFTKSV